MTIDFEYNISICNCGSDRDEREDYPLINLYLALPIRVITSLLIISPASSVLLNIKNKRAPLTLHFFFIANLMIADIAVAVIYNGAAIISMILTIANPMREGTDCSTLTFTGFPATADSMMLVALCFDRLYSVTAPYHYRRNMTKKNGYVIVAIIWLESLLLGFLSFNDPYLSNTTAKDAICDDPLLKAIIVPLFLSAVLVMVQNIYLYCSEKKTLTRSDTNNSTKTVAGEWETMKEKKKESIILLILSGTSMAFGLFHLVTSSTIQSQAGEALSKAILLSLILPTFYSTCLILHGVLYDYFLNSIHE